MRSEYSLIEKRGSSPLRTLQANVMETCKLRIRCAVAGLLLLLAAPASAADQMFEHVMNIGVPPSEGHFQYVEDFAFSRDGHLLVTDASHAWVQVFDRNSGRLLTRFGGRGEDNPHLEKPEGIAVDPEGNVFIADYSTGFIKKYDSSFQWVQTFSEYGSGKGQTMKSEFMDIRNGRLYVPEAGNHRVSVFDLFGKFLFDFGSKGAAPGQMNSPEAVKISSEGRLYLSDLRNDRIQVFDADGKPLMSFGRSGSGPGEFKSPAGLAFDKDDNVYVTEIGNNRIQVFDKSGKFLTMWGRKGAGNGEFTNLHGIIVDKVNGYVYAADTGNNCVQVFRPTRKNATELVR
jgi:DNA-binding beta-propeller fold protein YncE